MGAGISKQDILNETLNNVAIEVMQKNSTSISGDIQQDNTTTVAGNTGTVSLYGIKQINTSKLNVSALLDSAVNNSLQANLMAELKSTLAQSLPAISAYTDMEQKVVSSIKNNINSNITVENLQDISAKVKQNNTFQVLANNNVDTRDFVQKNEATLIMSMVNNMNAGIIADIAATGVLETDISNKANPLLPDFGSMYMIIIIIIIVVVCGGLYYLNTLEWKDIITKPIPLAVIAAISITVLGGLFYASSSSEEKK